MVAELAHVDTVLFLDFDGVLVTADDQVKNGGGRLDPEKVARLYSTIRVYGVHIVVSSAWRSTISAMQALLQAHGLKNARRWVVGVTPRLDGQGRGVEIKAWLRAHPNVKRCVILDDDDFDMGAMQEDLVRTDYRVGLTIGDCRRVIKHLLDEQWRLYDAAGEVKHAT